MSFNYFINYINYLLGNLYNTYIQLLIFACALCILLRFLVFIGFYTRLAASRIEFKTFNKKEEIKRTISPLLTRVIQSYKEAGESGATSIDASAITQKYMLRIGFMGISQKGVSKLAKGLQYIILFVGLGWFASGSHIALTENLAAEYCVISVVLAYLLTLIAEAVFNYETIYEKLHAEITEYVSREVGKFYSSDMGASLNNFKTTMQTILSANSESLKVSIESMSSSLANAVKQSGANMTLEVSKAMSGITAIGESLIVPAQSLRDAIVASERVCLNIVEASDKLNAVISKFAEAGIDANARLEAERRALESDSGERNRLTTVFISAVKNMQELAKNIELKNAAFEDILKFQQQNMDILDTSLQQYRSSIENVSSSISDIVSNTIEQQSKTASEVLVNNISVSMKQMMGHNNIIYEQMQQLFSELNTQSRAEMDALIKLKEQMDLGFENMKR